MADTLVPNAPFYMVLKPGALLSADGAKQYEPVGVHVDLQAATIHAGQIPGAAIVLNVCLFINPGA